ncbi:UNVERIFIED_CONTAM: hypothetical protein Slati_4403100 [Sesamum latifolium]|uniref:Uncharacterized protein n=1 Tax=Sesamum latifolium TaxID=2727402 RepID=A0AAW2SQG2_9LAMI
MCLVTFLPPAVSKLASRDLASSHPASSQPATRPVRDQASSHTASSRSAIRSARCLASSHPASSRPAIRLARYLRASVLVELALCELVANSRACGHRPGELAPCELAISDLAS